MWKNMGMLMLGPVNHTWELLCELHFAPKAHRSTLNSFGTADAHQTMSEYLCGIQEIYNETHRLKGLGRMAPTAFSERYIHLAQQATWKISREKNYLLLSDLYNVIVDLQLQVDATTGEVSAAQPQIAHIASLFVTSVHLLLGSETEWLIGTRGNRPTFKRLAKRASSPEGLIALFTRPGLYSNIRYLQSGDEFLVPEPSEWVSNPSHRQWPEASDDDVRRKLEDAYYNQHYVMDEGGAYVKICGCPYLESMNLKVRSGIKDPNYFDFLARFNFTDGSYLHVMDSHVAQGESPHLDRLGLAQEHRVPAFLNYLIAQIYHDLVTATELGFSQPRYITESRTDDRRENSSEISWIYIPRLIRGRPQESVRRWADTQRSAEPHRVRGYKRKGKITDRHRLELQSFEQETGLKVLEWLPDGYTFVRPHVSPSTDYESMAKLPHFIRVRMQKEIQELLAKPAVDDSDGSAY